MTAPVSHDLYVIYNIEDPESTATTLRFPSAGEKNQHIERLAAQQVAKELTFQLVPSLKFIRFQSKATLGALSNKVRDVIDPLISRRKLSTAPWFIEPKTGAHVKRHWAPGQPVGAFTDFEKKLAEAPAPRRPRPGR